MLLSKKFNNTISMPCSPLLSIFWPGLIFDCKCQVNRIFSSIFISNFERHCWTTILNGNIPTYKGEKLQMNSKSIHK